LGLTDLSDSATIAETILPDTERVLVTEIIKPQANVDREGRLLFLSDWPTNIGQKLIKAIQLVL